VELSPEVETLIDERPVDIVVPDGLDPAEPAPLVVVLHGYSGTGLAQDTYFGFRDEADRRGVLLAHPDGTEDQRGLQFWNATDACCNFFGSDVDDVAYLAAVVEYADSVHPVDPARVYLAGHSNGGFMSYRLACERPDLFAAIVSLAGAMVDDASTCAPDEPVSVVQVHGTLDDVIRYDGGDILGNAHPSAADTTDDWASLNGCDLDTEPAPALDLETDLAGDETTVVAYVDCPVGVAVELWTIPGGSHLPALGPGFAAAVFDFFEAHPDE
jgi:polyhydroxybutyrate depolymerase